MTFRRPSPRPAALTTAAAAIVAAVAVAACGSSHTSASPRPGAHAAAAALPARAPRGAAVLTLGRPLHVQAIRPGFVGLSLEYTSVVSYAGTNPKALDPAFVRLIENLNPGQSPVLRIGGDTTDWTWWPTPGQTRPAGVNYDITPGWLAVTRALTRAVGAHLILGINLEADSGPVAGAEARAELRAVGASSVSALELGNEPELYGSFTWDGSGRKGRPHSYDFAAFARDFAQIGRSLPPLPLAGPTAGAHTWYPDVKPFVSTDHRVRIVTLHSYPLQLCYIARSNPMYPTEAHLLAPRAYRGLAAAVAGAVAAAHAHHAQLRIDEMNTISCGQAPPVGFGFGSALWAVDALFSMARVGVDGVNMHSYPSSPCPLYTFTQHNGRWQAVVEPEYYGLAFFAQAAPPGSRLLSASGAGSRRVTTWATLGADGRTRVTLVNPGHATQKIALRARPGAGAATIERLRAPSLTSTTATLGGQHYGSFSGSLTGRRQNIVATPTRGYYVVRVPAGSAALVTLP